MYPKINRDVFSRRQPLGAESTPAGRFWWPENEDDAIGRFS